MGKIIDAIRKETNGTFEVKNYETTLIYWLPKFDHLGRPINVNPNYIDFTMTIDGQEYHITKHGWIIAVWNGPYRYTTMMQKDWEQYALEWEDLTPDYLKTK